MSAVALYLADIVKFKCAEKLMIFVKSSIDDKQVE